MAHGVGFYTLLIALCSANLVYSFPLDLGRTWNTPTITLEEHFLDTVFEPGLVAANSTAEWIIQKLTAPASYRIEQMDQAGITKQVISQSPVNGNLSQCQQTNNDLHSLVLQHPDRFAAWCVLPVSDPAAAVKELTRCVKELGFVGALIINHDNGHFYDNETYWPMFAQAVKLDVPIYLHPTPPTPAMIKDDFAGNYDILSEQILETNGWGWHELTGLHFLKLYRSGFFDQFPSLKLILGHMGEMVPFQVDRIIYVGENSWSKKKRDLRTVWNENIWITTSGFFTLPSFKCVLESKSSDKIMYSVDWPWANNTDGAEFLREVQRSGILTRREFEGVAYKNAMKLLNLKL
ncbi:putative 2-amino-3-carboxymuconate-6-semialdehyde decarboxylase [Xylogone sp. PMI_703]|nr:putative 2-amino-3-carboxymuconate-6-semialdehyde decarboxylase [Xylogone sp. PMI_703]